jgi:hypothetical protein
MAKFVHVVLIVAFLPAAAVAGAEKQVFFDHLKPEEVMGRVDVRSGEEFTIVIRNTLPDQFDYDVRGVKTVPAEKVQVQQETLIAGFSVPVVREKQIPVTHVGRYAGYIINVKPKTGIDEPVGGALPPEGTAAPKPVELRSVTFIVVVDQIGWAMEFAGGFVVSGLRSPFYELQTEEVSGANKQKVVRAPDKEDDVKLGISAFIHCFHERFPHLAATFGLGVNEGNQATYYLGGTWRCGGSCAFTSGIALGSVATLPTGVSEGAFVDDANVLGKLDSRIGKSWFFSVSYTFLGDKGLFKKPFAGEK